MSRRPKKVKVKEKEYKIVSRSKRWGKKHDAMGMITFNRNLIEVDESQSKEAMVDTVLHEILHAVVAEYGIKFKNLREEERVVHTMANGLTDVYKDNPALVDWIRARLALVPQE